MDRYGFAGANPVSYAEDNGHGSHSRVPPPRSYSWILCPHRTRAEREKCALVYMDSRHRRFGITKAQAAGFVGNWDVESYYPNTTDCKGVDSRCGQVGCSGCGFGIAQWGGDRKTGLYNFAGSRDNAKIFGAQLAWVWWELNHKESNAFHTIRGARGKGAAAVRHAARLIRNAYERPKIKPGQRGYLKDLRRRQRNAVRVYNGNYGGRLY